MVVLRAPHSALSMANPAGTRSEWPSHCWMGLIFSKKHHANPKLHQIWVGANIAGRITIVAMPGNSLA
jgi:hypothetical protein